MTNEIKQMIVNTANIENLKVAFQDLKRDTDVRLRSIEQFQKFEIVAILATLVTSIISVIS